ncbi:MAG: glycosyltransferase family 2 protein [bacterium]
MDCQRPALSVVVPCYNEQENVPVLCESVAEVLKSIDYELIVVENGSVDRSMELLERYAAGNSRIRIVQLSRNFTYQGGIAAGMAYARGNYVVTIDADLQDPLDLIPQMLSSAREGGYDVVFGVRRTRQEGIMKQAAYRAFYRLFRWLAPFTIPIDAGDFALMSRRALDAVLDLPERDRFIRGLRAWVGFKTIGIPYDRRARERGKSHFSVGSLFLVAFQGLFSFSFAPLRGLFYAGVAICLAIIPLILGYIAWREYFPGEWPPGVATIIVLQLTTIGIVTAATGLLGMYLSIIFTEVKGRPTYVVERLVNLQAETTAQRSPSVIRGR